MPNAPKHRRQAPAAAMPAAPLQREDSLRGATVVRRLASRFRRERPVAVLHLDSFEGCQASVPGSPPLRNPGRLSRRPVLWLMLRRAAIAQDQACRLPASMRECRQPARSSHEAPHRTRSTARRDATVPCHPRAAGNAARSGPERKLGIDTVATLPEAQGLAAIGSARRWVPRVQCVCHRKHWLCNEIRRPTGPDADLPVPQGQEHSACRWSNPSPPCLSRRSRMVAQVGEVAPPSCCWRQALVPQVPGLAIPGAQPPLLQWPRDLSTGCGRLGNPSAVQQHLPRLDGRPVHIHEQLQRSQIGWVAALATPVDWTAYH